MKKLIAFALLGMAVVGCTSGYKQASDGNVYLKSGLFGDNAQRPVQQQQQVQYPIAE